MCAPVSAMLLQPKLFPKWAQVSLLLLPAPFLELMCWRWCALAEQRKLRKSHMSVVGVSIISGDGWFAVDPMATSG